MAQRTHDQILDEMVHAIACVARHYGPGLNERGLTWVRNKLGERPWYTDACYSVDCWESDPYIDFHSRIINPDGWDKFDTLQTGREELGDLESMRQRLTLLVCREDFDCSKCEDEMECLTLTDAIDKLENA